MIDRPLAEMDESQLKAVLAETSRAIQAFQQTLSSYASEVRRRQKAMAILRDKFAVDPRTGRRIRRKGRGELDLTG